MCHVFFMKIREKYLEKFRRIIYFTKCKKKENLQINANITKNAKRTILQNIQKINYLFYFIYFHFISINCGFVFIYKEDCGDTDSIFCGIFTFKFFLGRQISGQNRGL